MDTHALNCPLPSPQICHMPYAICRMPNARFESNSNSNIIDINFIVSSHLLSSHLISYHLISFLPSEFSILNPDPHLISDLFKPKWFTDLMIPDHRPSSPSSPSPPSPPSPPFPSPPRHPSTIHPSFAPLNLPYASHQAPSQAIFESFPLQPWFTSCISLALALHAYLSQPLARWGHCPLLRGVAQIELESSRQSTLRMQYDAHLHMHDVSCIELHLVASGCIRCSSAAFHYSSLLRSSVAVVRPRPRSALVCHLPAVAYRKIKSPNLFHCLHAHWSSSVHSGFVGPPCSAHIYTSMESFPRPHSRPPNKIPTCPGRSWIPSTRSPTPTTIPIPIPILIPTSINYSSVLPHRVRKPSVRNCHVTRVDNVRSRSVLLRTGPSSWC